MFRFAPQTTAAMQKKRTPLLSPKLDVLRSQHEILSYASIPDQQPNLFSSGITLCLLWKGQHKSQPAFTDLPLFITAVFLLYPFLVYSSMLKLNSESLFLSKTLSFRNTLQFSDTITHNIKTSWLFIKAVKLYMLRNPSGSSAPTMPRSLLWFTNTHLLTKCILWIHKHSSKDNTSNLVCRLRFTKHE